MVKNIFESVQIQFHCAEKLSNLAYTLTDQLLEKREFTELTFDKYISKCISETGFEKHLETEIRTFFTKDSAISTTASFLLQPWFFKLIRKHFLWLIYYWLKDESKGFENTTPLFPMKPGAVSILPTVPVYTLVCITC